MAERNYQVEVLVALLSLYDEFGRPVSAEEVASYIDAEGERVTIAIRSLVRQGKAEPGTAGFVSLTPAGIENAKEWISRQMPELAQAPPSRYRDQKRYIESLRLLAYTGNVDSGTSKLAKERINEVSTMMATRESKTRWIITTAIAVAALIVAIVALAAK